MQDHCPSVGELAPYARSNVPLALPPGTLQLLIDLQRTHGDFFRVSTFRHQADIYVVAHPDLAQQVLTVQHADYRRFMLDGRGSMILGNGLLTSEGDAWKRQRRLLQQCFHGSAVSRLMQYLGGCSAAMLHRWLGQATAAEPIDLRAAAVDVSLEFNLRATFGGDMQMMRETLQTGFLHRLTATAAEDARSTLIFLRQLSDARQSIARLIADRRKRAQGSADLLSMFMSVQHRDAGQTMPDGQIIDEILGVLVAGHETVATALTCIWFEISRRPEVAGAIREEADRVLGHAEPDIARLDSLAYTKRVILEALRLHPPIWVYTRQALRASRIGRWLVPAGSHVFVCSYLIHRHGEFWEDAGAFEPERFSAQAVARRHRHAYLPYSKGPRHCIGDDLSMSELLFHVAAVVRAVQLEHVQGATGTGNSGFLMRPTTPILVRVAPRNREPS
jgi:cytochrome P450